MGKDACRITGLIVQPTIISANRHEELTILARALQRPLVVPAGTQLATAIAVPTTATCRAIEMEGQQPLTEDSDLTPEILWKEHIGHNRPILTCSLTHNNKTIMVKGLLDTGADVAIISYLF